MPFPVVIVLASGRGERFLASGGTTHKLKALLAGKPVLAHTLDAVRASGLPFHVEDAGHPGMGDSIAAGVRATRDAPGWLILPGDLPLIQPATLLKVADALSHARTAVAFSAGERGHPVGFAAVFGIELMALAGDTGAAGVLRAHPPLRVDVDDVGAVTDIDTVEDLQRAEAIARGFAGGAARPNP